MVQRVKVAELAAGQVRKGGAAGKKQQIKQKATSLIKVRPQKQRTEIQIHKKSLGAEKSTSKLFFVCHRNH